MIAESTDEKENFFADINPPRSQNGKMWEFYECSIFKITSYTLFAKARKWKRTGGREWEKKVVIYDIIKCKKFCTLKALWRVKKFQENPENKRIPFCWGNFWFSFDIIKELWKSFYREKLMIVWKVLSLKIHTVIKGKVFKKMCHYILCKIRFEHSTSFSFDFVWLF